MVRHGGRDVGYGPGPVTDGLRADREYLASTPDIGPRALSWTREEIEAYFADADRARAAFARVDLADQAGRHPTGKGRRLGSAAAGPFFAAFLGDER